MKAKHVIPTQPSGSRFNEDQWQAIHQRGTNLLISASAGSGKTTVLIERIMQGILNQVFSLDQVLVVTFTESAAREMKDRMEVRLKEAISKSQQGQADLLQELNKLEASHIRTLHSFCLQVIQQFAYLIGLNPDLTLITDDTQQEMIQAKVWEDLVAQILAGETTMDPADFDQVSLVLNTGLDDQKLLTIVLDIYQYAMANPEPRVWIDQMTQQSGDLSAFWQSDLYQGTLLPYCQAQLAASHHLVGTGQALLQSASQAAIDKYGPILAEDQALIETLLDLLADQRMADFINGLQTLAFKRWSSPGKALEEDKDLINQVKDNRDQAKDMVKALQKVFPYSYEVSDQIESQLVPLIRQVQTLVELYHQALTAYKADQAVIDYNDLEHLTLDILAPYDPKSGHRHPSPAAVYYQDLFQEVLVDEYQDINEIQAAILSWLSHEHRQDLAGNLFMVGDVKQSIYGFRMAEPSLFLQRYRDYQEGQGGDLIVLDRNYRSRFEILNYTNYLFERLMDPEFGEMAYGAQESLVLGNTSFPPADHFQVDHLLYASQEDDQEATNQNEEEDLEGDDDWATIDKAIQAEAYLVAQDIQAKIKSGFKVFDPEASDHPDKMRPLTFKDIVILSPTKASFLPLQEAFAAYKIPMLSQAVETYFQRQEIQLMVALLRIIDNPVQDIPLVAILRSHFVGLSDDDLAKIRIYQPAGSFYQAVLQVLQGEDFPDQALRSRLKTFHDQVLSWRAYAQFHSIDQLVWLIYQETAFLDYVMGLDNGPQRQANLHAFYQKAQTVAETLGRGLAVFIQYIDKLQAKDKDLAEPILLQEDQNMVRVMTIHASKGNEFPVVYLMNASRKFNLQDQRKPLVATKQFGVGIDYYDPVHMVKFQSISKKARQLLLTESSKAESMRLLYVALTRSKQKLILVGTIMDQSRLEEVLNRTLDLTDPSDLLINRQLRSGSDNFMTWVLQALALQARPQLGGARLGKMDFNLTVKTLEDIQSLLPVAADLTGSLDPKTWLKKIQDQVTRVEQITDPQARRLQVLDQAFYPHHRASQTASYQSVSELKRLYEEPPMPTLAHYQDRRPGAALQEQAAQVEIGPVNRYTGDTFNPPRFLQDQAASASHKGTLNHYLLQELQLAAFEGREDVATVLDQELDRLIQIGKLEPGDRPLIMVEAICHFIQSDLGQAMIANRIRLKREQAFSYLIDVDALYQDLAGEGTGFDQDAILIHGVIDAYFQLPDGRFVLLDYKTDRYRPYANRTKADQLAQVKDRYRYQLSLYRDALAAHLGQTCQACYLVALDFDAILEMD